MRNNRQHWKFRNKCGTGKPTQTYPNVHLMNGVLKATGDRFPLAERFGPEEIGQQTRQNGVRQGLDEKYERKAAEAAEVESVLATTERFPTKLTGWEILLAFLCLFGMGWIAVASLMNPAGFARDYMGTDDMLRPLIFASPIVLGGLLAKFGISRLTAIWQRRCECVLIVLGILGYVVYLAEFCRLFAVVAPLDGLNLDNNTADGTQNFSLLLFGQVAAETMSTYALTVVLFKIFAVKESARWVYIKGKLDTLYAELEAIKDEITDCEKQSAILQAKEAEYQALQKSFNSFCRASLDS